MTYQTTTSTRCGYAIRNGSFAPAMIPEGYADLEGMLRYMVKEAQMRDDLKASYCSEAVISIYPAEEVCKEGASFPLVRQVPGSRAYVHYLVTYNRTTGVYSWFPLD